MYYMFLILSFSMTIIFIFLNHPLSMGLILLIQTILISLISGMFTYTYWFSYILFLIMVGSMLVLFIYMTSLASNEMFNFSMKLTTFTMLIISTLMITYIVLDFMSINPMFKNSNIIEMYNSMMLMKNYNIYTLNKIYNAPNNVITLILMNYLFLTLIAIVKSTDIKCGPLRQKF